MQGDEMGIDKLIALDIKDLNKIVKEQQLGEDEKKIIKVMRRKKKVREYSKQKYVRAKTRYSKKVEERDSLLQEYMHIMGEIESLKLEKACFELADTKWNFDPFEYE